MLENAGSIFLGRWTPESVGDYASGTNHVLPTYGYARMYSGVSLDSFQKKITVRGLSLAMHGAKTGDPVRGCNHRAICWCVHCRLYSSCLHARRPLVDKADYGRSMRRNVLSEYRYAEADLGSVER